LPEPHKTCVDLLLLNQELSPPRSRSPNQYVISMEMKWLELSGITSKPSISIHILILTFNTSTWVSKTEMPPTIKLPLMLLMPSQSAKLESNVLLSLLMKIELKNSNSNKCGNPQTEPLETSWTVLYSESQSLSQTFQDLFQDGPSQSLLEDTHMVINTNAKTMLLISQERLNLYSLQKTEVMPLDKRSINSQEKELTWVCSTLRPLLNHSLDHACNTLLEEDIHSSFLQRILSWRNTMDFS